MKNDMNLSVVCLPFRGEEYVAAETWDDTGKQCRYCHLKKYCANADGDEQFVEFCAESSRSDKTPVIFRRLSSDVGVLNVVVSAADYLALSKRRGVSYVKTLVAQLIHEHAEKIRNQQLHGGSDKSVASPMK